MATPVSRGRGYSGRNKDICRPGNTPPSASASSAASLPVNVSKPPPPLSGGNAAPTMATQKPKNAQESKPNAYNRTSVPYPTAQPQNVPSLPVNVSKPPPPVNNMAAQHAQNKCKHGGQDTKGSSYSRNTAPYSGSLPPEPTVVTQHEVYVLNRPEPNSGHLQSSKQDGGSSRAFTGMGSLSDENSQSVLFIEERFVYLLKQVSVLSPRDDGILTNQKLQHIEGVISKACPNLHTLRCALDAVASAALLDAGLMSRVSLMSCSVWFSRSQLHGARFHRVFIEALTDKIDGLEVSLEGADQYLVNAVSLLTDIYTESKLLSSEELKTLALLIIQVLIELLDCNTPLALRTLNVQLMQYGRKLYECAPDKLDGVSLCARKLLVSRQAPPPPCRAWLALLADQCLYRFEPLPKHLQDFYARHLDETGDSKSARFKQKLPSLPKCEDDARFAAQRRNEPEEESAYKKQINKTNDRKSIKSDSSDRWSLHSNGESKLNNEDFVKYRDDVFDERESPFDGSALSDSNISDLCNNDYGGSQYGSERKPRPILGAGARLMPNVNQDGQFDFSEPPPCIVSDNVVEIPKFCASQPPPNFVPRSQILDSKSPGKTVTSAAQDNADFWTSPPPPLPNRKINSNSGKGGGSEQNASCGVASRLDLNSWRQQGEINHEDDMSNLTIDEFSTYNTNLNHDAPESNWTKCEEPVVDTGVSHWGKSKSDDANGSSKDGDKNNWGRNGRATNRNDSGWQERKETGWDKKDVEEKESNWRRRDSEDKKEQEGGRKSGQWGERRKMSGEVKSSEWNSNKNGSQQDIENVDGKRGEVWDDDSGSVVDGSVKSNEDRRGRKGGVRAKRDPMEVSRKASYWTHDDRCDKDYDG